jgi:hypothetical protein
MAVCTTNKKNKTPNPISKCFTVTFFLKYNMQTVTMKNSKNTILDIITTPYDSQKNARRNSLFLFLGE